MADHLDTYPGTNDRKAQSGRDKYGLPAIDDTFEIWAIDALGESVRIDVENLPDSVKRRLDAGEHRTAADDLMHRLNLPVTIQYTRKLTVRPRKVSE